MLTINQLPQKGLLGPLLYEVRDANGALVATINGSRSLIEIGGKTYTVGHKGFLGPERTLKDGDTALLSAKQKPFFNHYTLMHNGRTMDFKATNMLATRFGLFENGNETGSVSAGPGLHRMKGITAELPAELPPEEQAFFIYLAIFCWISQQSSS